MESHEVFTRLKERALDFLSVLTDAGVYQRALSEEDFLQRVDPQIQSTADNLLQGRGDPWATVLAFPQSLLECLAGDVYISSWDAMDGAGAYYTALQTLLRKAGYPFSWHFDPQAEKLAFELESLTWDVACKNLRWIDDPIGFARIEPNLTDFLKTEGWFLFPVTTGDSWGMYLLVPYAAAEPLKRYLIPAYGRIHPDYDPRSEWLYTGVPQNARPASIWDV